MPQRRTGFETVPYKALLEQVVQHFTYTVQIRRKVVGLNDINTMHRSNECLFEEVKCFNKCAWEDDNGNSRPIKWRIFSETECQCRKVNCHTVAIAMIQENISLLRVN